MALRIGSVQARLFIGLVTLILLLGVVSVTPAAPRAKLWQRWLAHDPASTRSIDHSRWNEWLRRFVFTGPDGVNRVAYAAVDTGARELLNGYIDSLASHAVSRYNRNEQRAFWINLYNALTIEVVLRHYPVDSIRAISSGLFSPGPWGLELTTIEDQTLTLDDIEHRILRPIWRDPRIHYAVNCASMGCPNLQREAYTAKNSERLLHKGAREFVNHPRGARVSEARLHVSSIYRWFAEDFGGTEAGIISHLRRYADAALADELATIGGIDDDSYDWRINDTATR